MLPLLSSLILLVTLGFIRRDGWQTATAAALLANWCVNTAFVTAVGDHYPWLFFIVTDYLTGLFVALLYRLRHSRWQKAVVSIYATQLVCHCAYGYVGSNPWSDYYGWHVLYYLAWGQVLFTGGWVAHDFARDRGWLDRRTPSAVNPVRAGEEA